MKYLLAGMMAIAITSVSGCASFHKEQLPLVQEMPDASHFHNQPSVYVDFDFYRGEPNSSPADVDEAEKDLKPLIENVINESNLFSKVSFSEFNKNNMDYTLQLRIYNHGPLAAAAVGGFITGFTFGVIPSAATDNFTVVLEVLDNNNEQKSLYKSENRDAITTWVGIWFIPVMNHTPIKAASASLENQIRQALKEAFESGTMQYSAFQQLLKSA